jgi:DNA-binding winged helix-turn-helix (wHTH) protein
MQAEQLLGFGPYRFALGIGQVWRGKQIVKLTPKALALLRTLVTRAGQVVTKEELLQAGWPQTVASDDALTACMQELRRALGDKARQPRYIETVHRRGFRFIAPLNTSPLPVGRHASRIQSPLPSPPYTQPPIPFLVGREAELTQLYGDWEKALSGERQLVFVTGEPGFGKTTVVEAFLMGIGRGQCVEHYGVGEAYLPVLEALGRLCREVNGKEVLALLRHQAPSWLVQMPALLSPAELEELQRRTAGVTRERMLRELAEALEVLTAERA